ncbi:MAG: branched-chain amino acid ABC transporter permease [candidate division NC10 bacterium]|nr:branched-chain amino acid ABC transporter permease [candidate division NC10 bacterium]
MIQLLASASATGLMLGGLYGALAVGLSLIFGIIRVINFAHGAFLMLSMYASFWLWYFFRINPYLSILLVGPFFFLFGYAVQQWIIRPMFVRERALVVEPLGVLLLTAGLDLVLSNLALLFFKSDYRAVISPLSDLTLRLGFLDLNLPRFLLFLLSFAITGGLYWILNHTQVGIAIRSVGQNREAAALCGVNVYRIYSLTFGLGTAALAVAGAAMTPFYYVNPSMGTALGVKSFIVVVLGGLGSIPGALLGGLILGVVESVAAQFVPATTSVIFSFLLFIIVMLCRPKGLMGRLEA